MPKFSVREIRYYKSGFHHPYIVNRLTPFGYVFYFLIGFVMFFGIVIALAWLDDKL